MWKFLSKIAFFFAIIAIVDFGFGKVCEFLRDNTKGGFTGNKHYICEECNEDIIMMGSSRMRHHYVPQVFEDSLGMTCYNAGIDGNGIILSYGFLTMIFQRYSPKLLVYDVTSFDMYESDNTKFLAALKSYYDRPGIQPIFKNVQWNEQWKMMSRLYRYNSDLFGLLGDYLYPLSTSEKGYRPIHKVMNYEPQYKENAEERIVDSLKLKYVEMFIDLAHAHDVALVFVASPTWFGSRMREYNKPVETICAAKEVPFIDRLYMDDICADKKYWGDANHLNDMGAREFSKRLSMELKAIVK